MLHSHVPPADQKHMHRQDLTLRSPNGHNAGPQNGVQQEKTPRCRQLQEIPPCHESLLCSSSASGHTLPHAEVLDGQHARRQQLELLVQLDAAPARGQLQAVVEHCREGLVLQ